MTAEAQPDSRLARGYGRLLLAYPRGWRREHGDEVLGVLMESGHAQGAGRPDRREAASLVGNGLLMRVESLFALWRRRTRERFALLALVALVALSVLGLAMGELTPWAAPPDYFGELGIVRTLGLGVPLALLPIGALGLVVGGRRRTAQGLLAGTAVLALALPGLSALTGIGRPTLYYVSLVFGLALLGAAVPVPVARRDRPALLLSVAVTASAMVAMILFVPYIGRRTWVEAAATFYSAEFGGARQIAADLTVLTAVAVVVIALLSVRVRGWLIPFAVACLPWWAVHAAFQANLEFFSGAPTRAYFAAAAAGTVALLVLVSRVGPAYRLVITRRGEEERDA